MPPISVKRILGALTKKGFIPTEGSKHTKLSLEVDGRASGITTVLSRSYPEYNDFMLGKVAKQLGLNRGRLNEFIECPLSYDEYVDMLRRNGKI